MTKIPRKVRDTFAGRYTGPERELAKDVECWVAAEDPAILRTAIMARLDGESPEGRPMTFKLIEYLPAEAFHEREFLRVLIRGPEAFLSPLLARASEMSEETRRMLFEVAAEVLEEAIAEDFEVPLHRDIPPSGHRYEEFWAGAMPLLSLAHHEPFEPHDPIGAVLERGFAWKERADPMSGEPGAERKTSAQETDSMEQDRSARRLPDVENAYAHILEAPHLRADHITRFHELLPKGTRVEIDLLAHPSFPEEQRRRVLEATEKAGAEERGRRARIVERFVEKAPEKVPASLALKCVHEEVAGGANLARVRKIARGFTGAEGGPHPWMGDVLERIWEIYLEKLESETDPRETEGAIAKMLDDTHQHLGQLSTGLRSRLLALAGPEGRSEIIRSLEEAPPSRAKKRRTP